MEQQATAFFWGLCLLASGWTICGASVSENLDESISELKKYYGERAGELHNGQPIFLQILKDLKVDFEEPEQRLLMSIVIETYSRIFKSMMNESKDEDMRERLEHVQEHLRRLQQNYFLGKISELRSYAETLWAIKEDDPPVQCKALHELKKVFRDATELKNNNNTDRRRRQAKSLRSQKS